jgi:hypothetical protein
VLRYTHIVILVLSSILEVPDSIRDHDVKFVTELSRDLQQVILASSTFRIAAPFCMSRQKSLYSASMYKANGKVAVVSAHDTKVFVDMEA